ncbi:MAG: TMEM175 family protein [Candidatus Wukongarchaeota archaeon]|nr:TMEM175 family protein [Candidatus Wukongarchaeota archaeon]MDO8127965.1 TMEM175 family protein [Candidatus Wukongarchaeota archaeon]
MVGTESYDTRVKKSETEKLSQELLEMFPKFHAYILSFVVLGIFRVIHHYQFHYIRRSDGVLLWIKLAFLMTVALIPFTTSLVGEYHEEKVAVILYETNCVISLLLLYAIWPYAAGSQRLVDSDIEQRVLAQINKIIITGIFFILIGIGIAL